MSDDPAVDANVGVRTTPQLSLSREIVLHRAKNWHDPPPQAFALTPPQINPLSINIADGSCSQPAVGYLGIAACIKTKA
ncbi:hypothetical protein [Mesorhizobium sp.]|uniref:hypothetical protein n=1 Tax=Mesorhizobium sp. TaxID=1871066 RepID=UPI001218F7EF|nr:hypothetical protein [Mesorhizobium sp.]TIS46015.1 MAG: hypothetical protein E5W96_28825 [Mesorhizobium sp.]